MPDSLRISLPAGLPELTIQRMILLILLIVWLRTPRKEVSWNQLHSIKLLLLLSTTQMVSMITSVSFNASLKHFLSLNVEIILFYIILGTSLHDRERMLRYVCSGLGIVAILAAIEKYTAISIVGIITGTYGGSDIISTYPHRILLGYAMAMGLPLQMYLTNYMARGKNLLLSWSILLLLIAACYFSQSRGPWFGMVLAGSCMLLIGSRFSRRKLIIVACLAIILIYIRPGVYDTIMFSYDTTFDEESLKGKSYEYRWKLWGIAWSEINKSFSRTLFGYGGLSHEIMDLSRYFEREAGGTTELLGHTSFDNHLAANMLEFGVIGVAVEILLYCRAVGSLFIIGMRHKDRDREFYTAIITSVGIFIYAMTTVYIFSPQLRFLYWSLFANGLLKSNGRKSLQLLKSTKTQEVSVNLGANTGLLGATGVGSKKVGHLRKAGQSAVDRVR
jgi:hypothetical protein